MAIDQRPIRPTAFTGLVPTRRQPAAFVERVPVFNLVTHLALKQLRRRLGIRLASITTEGRPDPFLPPCGPEEQEAIRPRMLDRCGGPGGIHGPSTTTR